MEKIFKVGLLQLTVKPDKDNNLLQGAEEIMLAAHQGAELVVLPEMFCAPYDVSVFEAFSEGPGGPAWRMLSQAAKDNAVFIVGGSIPEQKGDGKLYNTSYVFNPRGEEIARYRKMHLFDVDIQGGQTFKESSVICPGDGIVVVQTPKARIGVAICFDIRFAEQALAMSRMGVDVLVYPAAFNMTTGPAHWELLFRARALDAQAYAIGVAPARQEDACYISWAHSLVVNPWGHVIADLGVGKKTQVVDLDMEEVSRMRRDIPIGLQ